MVFLYWHLIQRYETQREQQGTERQLGYIDEAQGRPSSKLGPVLGILGRLTSPSRAVFKPVSSGQDPRQQCKAWVGKGSFPFPDLQKLRRLC